MPDVELQTVRMANTHRDSNASATDDGDDDDDDDGIHLLVFL